jgi:hypothetical protein
MIPINWVIHHSHGLILLLNLNHLRWGCCLRRSRLKIDLPITCLRSFPFLSTRIVTRDGGHICFTFLSVLTLDVCLELVIFWFQIFIRVLIDSIRFFGDRLWLRLVILLALTQILHRPRTLRRLQPLHFTILLSSCNKVILRLVISRTIIRRHITLRLK